MDANAPGSVLSPKQGPEATEARWRAQALGISKPRGGADLGTSGAGLATAATALRTRAVPAPPPRVGTYSGCGGGGSSAGRWRCRHPWVRTRTLDWPPGEWLTGREGPRPGTRGRRGPGLEAARGGGPDEDPAGARVWRPAAPGRVSPPPACTGAARPPHPRRHPAGAGVRGRRQGSRQRVTGRGRGGDGGGDLGQSAPGVAPPPWPSARLCAAARGLAGGDRRGERSWRRCGRRAAGPRPQVLNDAACEDPYRSLEQEVCKRPFLKPPAGLGGRR